MAWRSTDGPETGPEWHGDDRGADSRLGCAVAVIAACLVIVAITFWMI